MKREQRTLYLNDDVWQRLVAQADHQDRSFSAEAERILDKHLPPLEQNKTATPKRSPGQAQGGTNVDDSGVVHEPVYD